MNYYLATTGIPETWNLESKLLLLGPWCLSDEKNKGLLENKEYKIIPSPWKPVCKIKGAADYCHQVYEELLLQLSESLNSLHHVDYPMKYWRVLVGPWLLHFIGVLYDRYNRIKKAFELYPDCYTHVLPIEQCELTSFDMYDFAGVVGKVGDDYYNLKLFSIVAYDICPHNVVEKHYKFEYKSEICKRRQGLKKRIFYSLTKPLLSKGSIVLADMYHLTYLDILLLKWKTGFKVINFRNFKATDADSLKDNYSHKFREAWNLEGASDRFQSLLYNLLPDAIPMCYMENYKFYRNSIRSTDSVKVVGSAVGWFFNERFKSFAAEAVSKGANLIDFQHGGGYGQSLSAPTETIALEKDIFYTWGWNSETSSNIKPLPSPYLSRLKDSHSPKMDRIIFVGTSGQKYHYRFDTGLLPEDMKKYFFDKKIFFQTLLNEIKNEILYRPYSHDLGYGEVEAEVEVVKKACPNVKFLYKGRLTDWMKKVKLVVIDHPHTSFIEALTINVPSVFYWDHDVYLMRPEAEEYFDVLRKAGILYKKPEDAAKKLIEVFDDPIEWWRSKDVQDARNIFLERFGYSRKDWLKIWAEELKQIQKRCINNGLTYEQK